ncbi:hypothetical protein DB31_2924 [Hyalangium minutum]|uniref:Uncharacterized protein n=1 Tax=Hyalangium minutum TaxID=394096 RepID=A0A085W6L8_9BACT|nr:hypothetical protein DB31_2924 [Hyalangium minutum]
MAAARALEHGPSLRNPGPSVLPSLEARPDPKSGLCDRVSRA